MEWRRSQRSLYPRALSKHRRSVRRVRRFQPKETHAAAAVRFQQELGEVRGLTGTRGKDLDSEAAAVAVRDQAGTGRQGPYPVRAELRPLSRGEALAARHLAHAGHGGRDRPENVRQFTEDITDRHPGGRTVA